ncbi:gephyrin-like molybdotransferase receptor GlpR [Streptomyces sp. NPDC057137]|uniref:divisome protein SepX/GlpR n=1 Tax=Streptomyces sp. NPDC057137 TaxID=3346030 RepID=UPI003626E6B7
MSSSGLIYAVIVGAWAAYLVPMWLRRQDELNEARPTERFSTAIRLLSGRAAMERRYAKELQDRTTEEAGPDGAPDVAAEPTSSVDVRSFSAPAAHTEARLEIPAQAPSPPERRARPSGAAAERARRAQRSQVLARRRRTTVVLFLAFTIGAIAAGVQGLAFLWAPGVPAVLLSAYIVHLRAQERRRFVFTMDRRRAEIAAQRLRENRPRRHHHQASAPAAPDEDPEPRPAPEPAASVSPQEAGRRALVEQTDHAEWVDQQRERERGPARGDSWEPVPVPLPTYVTAPVAPRATGGVNVSDPETWSAARSSTAEPTPAEQTTPEPPAQRRPRDRGRGRTPLFDQYDEDDRPRAANE